MKRIVFLLLLFFSVTACSIWEDGPYEVKNTDGYIRLVYKINNKGGSVGRVSGQILAVGSNDKYVVAKRKQYKSFAIIDKEPLTNELMYYYIEREKDGKYAPPEEVVRGPYSFEEFSRLKSNLGLPEFTKKIK